MAIVIYVINVYSKLRSTHFGVLFLLDKSELVNVEKKKNRNSAS